MDHPVGGAHRGEDAGVAPGEPRQPTHVTFRVPGAEWPLRRQHAKRERLQCRLRDNRIDHRSDGRRLHVQDLQLCQRDQLRQDFDEVCRGQLDLLQNELLELREGSQSTPAVLHRVSAVSVVDRQGSQVGDTREDALDTECAISTDVLTYVDDTSR